MGLCQACTPGLHSVQGPVQVCSGLGRVSSPAEAKARAAAEAKVALIRAAAFPRTHVARASSSSHWPQGPPDLWTLLCRLRMSLSCLHWPWAGALVLGFWDRTEGGHLVPSLVQLSHLARPASRREALKKGLTL